MRFVIDQSFPHALALCMISLSLIIIVACSPSITNLQPGAGVPGDKIIITGGKLTVGGKNPVSVDFNGTAAQFTPVGNTVEAVVPQGATTGPVHVKTNYVNSSSRGGTAVSPFDFTVIDKAFLESENNDTQQTANNANLAGIIKGKINAADKADWFKINSGSAGPWGYGIEIVAEPVNLPEGVSLRVDMEGYRADLNAVGHLNTFQDDKAFTLWTTHAPNTDIYLNVYWAGSISKSFNADYTLKISRIKINDSNEEDNSLNFANGITMTNGTGTHNASYLCNIFKKGEAVGMKDFYSFAAGDATQISVVVTSPGLAQTDSVVVDLYDNTKGYRGGDNGSPVAANYNLKLPNGEKANGQWYIEVTNSTDNYTTVGTSAKEPMPQSCKLPYAVTVVAR